MLMIKTIRSGLGFGLQTDATGQIIESPSRLHSLPQSVEALIKKKIKRRKSYITELEL